MKSNADRWHNGIILHTALYGNANLLLKIFSLTDGIIVSFARNGKFKNNILQIGNLIDYKISRKSEGQLGTVSCNIIKSYANVICNDNFLYTIVSNVCNTISKSLPEKDNTHSEIFRHTIKLFDELYHKSLEDRSLIFAPKPLQSNQQNPLHSQPPKSEQPTPQSEQPPLQSKPSSSNQPKPSQSEPSQTPSTKLLQSEQSKFTQSITSPPESFQLISSSSPQSKNSQDKSPPSNSPKLEPLKSEQSEQSKPTHLELSPLKQEESSHSTSLQSNGQINHAKSNIIKFQSKNTVKTSSGRTRRSLESCSLDIIKSYLEFEIHLISSLGFCDIKANGVYNNYFSNKSPTNILAVLDENSKNLKITSIYSIYRDAIKHAIHREIHKETPPISALN